MSIKKTVKRLANYAARMGDNLQLLYEIIIASFIASRDYRQSLSSNLIRSYRLVRLHRFRPKEALVYGLYDQEIKETELGNYISKRELTQKQALVNPQNWFWVIESKDLFYRYCKMLSIPVPKLYAIYYKNSSGWTSSDKVPLSSIDDWSKFADMNLPESFVVKPAKGVYGMGLKIYDKYDGYFQDAEGRYYSSKQLFGNLVKDKIHDSFVIQERLRNHPDLNGFTATKHLQSLRIITLIDNHGDCNIVFAFLKLITGDSIIDNFHRGETGNLAVKIEIETGVLGEPYGAVTGKYTAPVPEHPDLHNQVEGAILPLWPDTCACVKDAALKFYPVRAIGWDVAITPDGPVIIEGNIRFDPPHIFGDIGLVQQIRYY